MMNTTPTPQGIVVPMVTPVTAGGDLDAPAVRRILDWLVEGGVDGIFVLGTTGEAASLAASARRAVVALSAEHLAGRRPLYAGIGGNAFAESRDAAREYRRLGADAVVAHLPAYFPLNRDEMVGYYRNLADDLDGPLLIYNMPPTTHMSIPIDALEELSQHPRILGVKDSENDLERLRRVIATFRDRPDFAVLIGPALHAVETLRCGVDGIVPSSGNLTPQLWHELYAQARAARWAEAERLQATLNEVARLYQNGRSLGQSMAALKAAMAARGLCGPTALLPLRTLDGDERERIARALRLLALA